MYVSKDNTGGDHKHVYAFYRHLLNIQTVAVGL